MLMHFEYTTAEMTSAEAIARANAAFQRELNHPYSKTAEGLFEELRSRMHFAEANAERLKKWHADQGTDRPSRMNPCTALPEITTMLSDYIESTK